VFAAALTCTLIAASVEAQVRPQPAEPPVGIRAYAVAVEWQRMTAAETFEAVTGSSAVTGFGGGVDVLRIAGSLFARVALTYVKVDGQRVAIAGDEVIPFDPPIALEITMRPIEIGAGWRFAPRVRPGARPTFSRVTPYVGGGLLLVRYRETSAFDEPGEDAPVTFTGATMFGGVDLGIGAGFIVGGEAQYRILPNALGEAGVSAHFGETDLGGFAVRLIVGYRR
jgi:hypothetical protein